MARPHPALLALAGDRPPGPVDDPWALIESARDHRMAGLLWVAFSGGTIELPSAAAHELARIHLWTRAHHRKLWRAAEVISGRLAEAGAQAALFKGVAAEQRWYGEEGARPCNDLDLWLRPSDFARLEEVIAALRPDEGLRPTALRLLLTGELQSVDLRIDGVDVDLHVDLLKMEIPLRAPEQLWQRCEAITSPHGTVLTAVDAETSLVQFLIHVNRDRFARLIELVDIARLAQSGVDWDVVARVLDCQGMSEVGAATLQRVAETLDVEVPSLPTRRGWRTAAWSRLWPRDTVLEGRAGLLRFQHRELWLPFLARGRFLDALRWWLRRRVLPSPALLEYQHPAAHGPYPWRLVTGRLRRFRERRIESRTAPSTSQSP